MGLEANAMGNHRWLRDVDPFAFDLGAGIIALQHEPPSEPTHEKEQTRTGAVHPAGEAQRPKPSRN